MQTAPEHAHIGPIGDTIRGADAKALATALQEGRELLLRMFQGFEAQLQSPALAIAYDPVLNLPLWELGHIGWFEEWWISRNAGRNKGTACKPDAPRAPSVLPNADRFYDSAHIPHGTRWDLALPDAAATRAYLAQVRERTLAALQQSEQSDDALYFFRLVLFHEDMHREAWFMMAQHLGFDLGVPLPNPAQRPPGTITAWRIPVGQRRVGALAGGFAFDNELQAHALQLPAFSIDRQVVTWRQYLPFLEQGGYQDEKLWTTAGWQWCQQHRTGAPLHLRRHPHEHGLWEQRCFGHWQPLDLDAPAVHLSAHEAQAWCRFSGRRLPTEAEWETAARLAPLEAEAFLWGSVWEWTSSAFLPYPGFVAHPYREYSEPFFDGRPVLRGGSCATHPRMLNPAYRNYFSAARCDVFAGFRSCAL